ncbi:hypothetical protein AAJ76_1700060135 [Vairimorpha ceranae]|uniref:Uncharacterized protein n=1 Tax=Vairimorpha ceranae TaxID=40302 RepID=A0A0F9WDU7_9MICR|nr:hypothetical protein AAJ76_1700060135 [Vairimorpha ceranae]KKO75596.1 hypothetical protein AAJ76_1700060135 [Vairimorpha ceranae]
MFFENEYFCLRYSFNKNKLQVSIFLLSFMSRDSQRCVLRHSLPDRT